MTSDTVATGSHANYTFRGVIRGGQEVEGNSILAVEIHMTSDSSESERVFDAWLSIYSSSASDNCFIVGNDVTMDTDKQNAFNWNKEDFYTSSSFPVTIDYAYNGNSIPVVNGFRVFASGSVSAAPKTFSVAGSSSISGDYTTMLSVEDATYDNTKYKQWISTDYSSSWRHYRVTVQNTGSNTLSAYELQPLVCNVPVLTKIDFPQSSYLYLAQYDQVDIRPVKNYVTDCSISPELPAGLELNGATCSISGVATAPTENITYTMTSSMSEGLSGTFSLKFTSCDSLLVEVERVYRLLANNEAYTIYDDETNEILLNVPLNHGNEDDSIVKTNLCLTSTRIRVETTGNDYWTTNSYINLRTVMKDSEKEMIGRIHRDSIVGTPNPYVISTLYPIRSGEEWNYKMGEVPANWYSSSVEGWEHNTVFPASSNRIQLYKKTFSIGSLSNVTSFTLNVKYRYGMIIMMNDHEVFRNAVEGDLSSESTASNSYTDNSFHLVSLPTKVYTDNNEVVNYLVEGSNTIAIALVSITATQTESIFDCTIRLISDTESSRVWDYDYSTSLTIGYDPFSMGRFDSIYAYSNNDNEVTLQFNNDRREWINMITIMNDYLSNTKGVESFILEAKNREDESWTQLASVSDIEWSIAGQTKQFYLLPTKPFNTYQFRNFKGKTTSGWKVLAIDLHIETVNMDIAPLSYPTPIEIYRGIEMAEVYCETEYYLNFRVEPQLPEGITIDHMTGMISGTATEMKEASQYTITATKLTGGTSSFVITLSVSLCTNGKGLITMTVRTDYYPERSHYNLYSGKEVSGDPISTSDTLGQMNTLVYYDFCLPDGIYTMQIVTERSEGMSIPSGYMLSVDVGTFRLDMQQVPPGVSPIRTTLQFSSYIPFQNEFSEWLVSKQFVSSDWTSVSFQDSNWESLKAGEIGTASGSTVYLRRHFSIPSLEDYQAMNVMVKYGGGLIAYVNGKRVARFNLPDDVDDSTRAPEAHDPSTAVFFHVILPFVKATLENNVIAIELHQVVDTSSSVPFDFYATATFGVSECSVLRDSFLSLTGPPEYPGDVMNFFDLSPITYGTLYSSYKNDFAWTSKNLEGMSYNAMAVYTNEDVNKWSFSIYGKFANENFTTIAEIKDFNTTARTRGIVSIPVGVASFSYLKLETDALKTYSLSLVEMMFMYCKASGSICEGVDDFPTVAEGQISPALCGEGFDGYAYRVCENGVFSEVKTDKCIYKVPQNIEYSATRFEFVQNIFATTGIPKFTNKITEWYLASGQTLPEGLQLNKETGEISGVPVTVTALELVHVFGKNPSGVASTEITISVRVGRCISEGIWSSTDVDTIAVYDCALQGAYVGTQKRACVLGEKDGEWRNASGFCISIATLVVVIIIVIIVLLFLILLVIRNLRKTKSVRGMKTEKKPNGKKVKTQTTRTMKV